MRLLSCKTQCISMYVVDLCLHPYISGKYLCNNDTSFNTVVTAGWVKVKLLFLRYVVGVYKILRLKRYIKQANVLCCTCYAM